MVEMILVSLWNIIMRGVLEFTRARSFDLEPAITKLPIWRLIAMMQ